MDPPPAARAVATAASEEGGPDGSEAAGSPSDSEDWEEDVAGVCDMTGKALQYGDWYTRLGSGEGELEFHGDILF